MDRVGRSRLKWRVSEIVKVLSGHSIRKRSCKTDNRCSIDSNLIETKDCYVNSCMNDHSNLSKKNLFSDWPQYQSNDKYFKSFFIFLFPFLFTLICLPLCILYYIYEMDFKIHACFMYGFAQCNRCCETTTSITRGNRNRRRRRINII